MYTEGVNLAYVHSWPGWKFCLVARVKLWPKLAMNTGESWPPEAHTDSVLIGWVAILCRARRCPVCGHKEPGARARWHLQRGGASGCLYRMMMTITPSTARTYRVRVRLREVHASNCVSTEFLDRRILRTTWRGCCCKVGRRAVTTQSSSSQARCVPAFSGSLEHPTDDHRVRVRLPVGKHRPLAFS